MIDSVRSRILASYYSRPLTSLVPPVNGLVGLARPSHTRINIIEITSGLERFRLDCKVIQSFDGRVVRGKFFPTFS